MNLRLIRCDYPKCSAQQIEPSTGEGFLGWGQVSGISLDGIPNPALCPDHLALVADALNKLSEEK